MAGVVLAVRRSSIISHRRFADRVARPNHTRTTRRFFINPSLALSQAHRALIAPVLLHRRSRIRVAVSLRCVFSIRSSGPSSPSSVRLLRAASHRALQLRGRMLRARRLFVHPPSLAVPLEAGRAQHRVWAGSSCIRSMLAGRPCIRRMRCLHSRAGQHFW